MRFCKHRNVISCLGAWIDTVRCAPLMSAMNQVVLSDLMQCSLAACLWRAVIVCDTLAAQPAACALLVTQAHLSLHGHSLASTQPLVMLLHCLVIALHDLIQTCSTSFCCKLHVHSLSQLADDGVQWLCRI